MFTIYRSPLRAERQLERDGGSGIEGLTWAGKFGDPAGIAAWLRRHILVPRSLHPWKLPKIPDQGPGKDPLASSAPHQGWHPLVGESRPPSIHPLRGPACPAPIPHHSGFPPKFGWYHFIYVFIHHYHVSSISKYSGGRDYALYIFLRIT